MGREVESMSELVREFLSGERKEEFEISLRILDEVVFRTWVLEGWLVGLWIEELNETSILLSDFFLRNFCMSMAFFML